MNLSGIWLADLELSRFKGPAPARLTIGIEHDGDRIIEKLVTEMPGGATHSASFEFSTDGAQRNGIRALWENAKTLRVEASIKSNGRSYEFRDFWTLSDDGSLLTMEHRDDGLDGQICVLRKR